MQGLGLLCAKERRMLGILGRYVLSCGKDSQVRLWEVGSGRQVKQYQGAQHSQMRCQVCYQSCLFGL